MLIKYNPVDWYISRNWRVTSPYGRRTHPVTGELGTMHWGVDFGIPRGGPLHAPVPSSANGRVWRVGDYGSRGLTVLLHVTNSNELMLFQHLHQILVRPNELVQIEQPIGLCGTTGRSTGIHLHFEIRIFDNRTDLGSGVWGDPSEYYFNNTSLHQKWQHIIDRDQPTISPILQNLRERIQNLRR